MREFAQYGNNEVPIPVFYVLEIYQDTFRHEKPVVEIHTAEPLSPVSVGDYLYEVSFPDPLADVSAFTHEGCLWRKVHRTGGECAEFVVHIRRHRVVELGNDTKIYSDPSPVRL